MIRIRYRKIILFFARVILNLAFWEILVPGLGLRSWSEKGRSKRWERFAKGYRQLAIEMGGVLIKVGQFLSARVDLLPPEVTEELSGLQDKVPPERYQDIRRLAEEELGSPLEERFTRFEKEPLASASLGQVHRAELKPTDLGDMNERGIRHVVVKIQRPNIETLIETDLSALKTVINWIRRYPPIRKRADLPTLLDEFSRILYQEIDYLAEGRNAEAFRENFKGDPRVKVPQVIWSHTTKRVLTLEDVYAIKVTDYQAITEAGVDRSKVAHRLFDTYLEQIFNHEFFHADPHPGNLFVILPEKSAGGDEGISSSTRWQLAFVDFGMVGHVPEGTRPGLREGVIGMGTKDPKRVVEAYQKLNILLPDADIEAIERAEAKAFERFWGKSMADLRDMDYTEWREFAKEYRQLVYTMPFQIPQNLILLGRTVAILSGMCTGLDPEFNVWKSIRPFAEELLSEEMVPNWELWWEELESLLFSLIAVPRRLETVLRQMEQGEFSVRLPEVRDHLLGIERKLHLLIEVLVFIALLTGGIQFYLADEILLGWILLGIALLILAWMILLESNPG